MKQPRKPDGTFKEQKEVKSDDDIEFYLTEFQCRVIGNRLERASNRYKEVHEKIKCDLHQDCHHWAIKFLEVANTREEGDYKYHTNGKKRHLKPQEFIKIELTDYECWNIGLRLYEIGEWYENKGHEYIAQETKWLARKFHAEKKNQEQ